MRESEREGRIQGFKGIGAEGVPVTRITYSLVLTTLYLIGTAQKLVGYWGGSPPEVDRIWLRVYYNKIPIYPIFYLLKWGLYRYEIRYDGKASG